jgi:hypothetical protein
VDRSYVLGEPDGSVGTVCIYQASSPEAIREHAGRVGRPADEIIAVADTVIVRADPVSAPSLTARRRRCDRNDASHFSRDRSTDARGGGTRPAAGCGRFAGAACDAFFRRSLGEPVECCLDEIGQRAQVVAALENRGCARGEL